MKRYSSRWLRLREKNKIIGNNIHFLRNDITYLSYRDTETLKHFVNKQGQIIPAIFNKLTHKFQKKVAKAIKRARQMALMAYNVVDQSDSGYNNFQPRFQGHSQNYSKKTI